MGGGSSKEAQLSRLGQLLSEPERYALELAFATISGSQEAQNFSETQFKAYIVEHYRELEGVAAGLFYALRAQPEKREAAQAHERVTFPDFVQNASAMLRGSPGQRAQRLHLLCGGQAATMESSLLAFLSATLSAESQVPHLGPWPSSSEATQVLSQQLSASLGCSEEGQLSTHQLEAWLSAEPAASRVMDSTFALCFYREALSSDQPPAEARALLGLPGEEEGEEGQQRMVTERVLVPVKIRHPLLPETFSSLLLSRATLLMLTQHLPVEVRGQLCPLFSSRLHGESFSTMCKALVGRGPTLLVIRDSEGHVFGGFAADSWQIGPQFIGGPSSFLFSLAPKQAVYSATGYNQNFMYLQQNAQTLPNGLGMGGQLDYFGLWLSGEYGVGHSRGRPQCTTYGSPSLSASEDFQLDQVEVWGVGPPLIPENDGASQPSILDKDKVASALLEMAGKTRHSDGLREPPEDDI